MFVLLLKHNGDVWPEKKVTQKFEKPVTSIFWVEGRQENFTLVHNVITLQGHKSPFQWKTRLK
jgi:hypothetical protein